MDRRLLLAIALSALVVIAYQEYLRIFYPRPTSPKTAEEPPRPTALPAPAPNREASLPKSLAGPPPEPDISVETALFEARLASRGGRLASFRLKKYRASIDPASPGFELVPGSLHDGPLGVVLRGREVATDAGVSYEPSARELKVRRGESAELVLRGVLPGGSKIEKRLRFRGDRYDFELLVSVEPLEEGFSEVGLAWVRQPQNASGTYRFQGVEALVGKKLRHFGSEELARGTVVPDPQMPTADPVRWAGYSDTYFLSALVPPEGSAARLWLKMREDGTVATEVLLPRRSDPGAPYGFVVYAGPKDMDRLHEAGHDLVRTVELGWFGFVAEPLLRVLKFFHKATGNYGLDIILLTVLIKVAFFPLTQKSFRSMQQLQKLQPELKRIQERYKDDRERLNREVMELYRRYKVNPLGGCLPMLIQLPIFVGLYNALLSAVELRHAPFVLWINDLSAPDRLPAVPAPPLAVVAGFEIRIPVLTLLMGASMLIQQKMAPPAGDPAQQRIMMLMPLVFTAMFVNFPSGLVLYWFVNNILTIAQQAWMQARRI